MYVCLCSVMKLWFLSEPSFDSIRYAQNWSRDEFKIQTNYPTLNLYQKAICHHRRFSVPGRITRPGINPVFRRIMRQNIVFSWFVCLGDVLRDKSVEDDFNHVIPLNTGFIPKQDIHLRQTNYPSQTCNSSLIQIRPLTQRRPPSNLMMRPTSSG